MARNLLWISECVILSLHRHALHRPSGQETQVMQRGCVSCAGFVVLWPRSRRRTQGGMRRTVSGSAPGLPVQTRCLVTHNAGCDKTRLKRVSETSVCSRPSLVGRAQQGRPERLRYRRNPCDIRYCSCRKTKNSGVL